MSSTPTTATPGLLSVANLLESIQQNFSVAPASTASEELQATQLLFEDDMHMAPTPLKVEKEGDPGTLGLPGGGDKGVPLVLLSPGNAQDYCLGRIGHDRVCLLQKGLCDVAKHERQKVEVKEPMIHIMTPATKRTKFAAYETPALAVDLLADLHYSDLIR
jgi:hypothetical protein